MKENETQVAGKMNQKVVSRDKMEQMQHWRCSLISYLTLFRDGLSKQLLCTSCDK